MLKKEKEVHMNFEDVLNWLGEPVSLLLTGMYGDKSEIVVCKVTGEKNLKIVYSKNSYLEHMVGFIYNGLEVSPFEDESVTLLKEININSGKYIQSCTVPIKYNHELLGTITVNTDITNLVFAQQQLSEMIATAEPATASVCSDVNELMDNMINRALEEIGKPVAYMKRKDKREFIKYLDERGFFQIKKSSDRITNYLNISKYTLYSHLEDIRSTEYEENNGISE